MKNAKTKITILLLVIILCGQILLMNNYSYTNDIFQINPTGSRGNSYNNLVELLGINLNKDLTGKDRVLIFSDEKFTAKGNGITNLYLKYELIPNIVPLYFGFYTETKKLTESYVKKMIKENDATVILIMGKDVNTYLGKTTNEINLYRVESPDKISKINCFDMTLYDLYKNSTTKEAKERYETVSKNIMQRIIDYYDFDSIDIIYHFVLDLLENDEIEMAKEYGEFYYSRINTLDATIDTKLGDIYFSEKKFDIAKKYYYSCLQSKDCDKDYINEKLKRMEGE